MESRSDMTFDNEESHYSKGGKFKNISKGNSSKVCYFGCTMQGNFKNEFLKEKKSSKPNFTKKNETNEDYKRKKNE